MNICSLVVHARPERVPAVAERLDALPGVEVHGRGEGRLVITVEDTAETLAADTLAAVNAVNGVISTALIYHYGGGALDEPLLEEEHS
ncbi:MAG: chaperone NapD [Chromatiaceae bacterium]|jgi:nitrate reductase NapD|nr:chaperone NapD [Chromatiaceae bacterium]